MDLSEVLDERVIDLGLTGTTKDEILRELSQHLLEAGYISDVEQFVKDIYAREAQGITGAGNHIAIPHGKSSAVRKVTIAIGRTDHMVPWESYDDEPVNLFFLFCVSDGEDFAREHMRLLSELARRIGKDDVVEGLQGASTPAEVIRVLSA